MKWFKHKSDLHQELEIKVIFRKYGLTGYGLLLLLKEIVSKHSKNFKIKQKKCWMVEVQELSKLDEKKIEEILRGLSDLDLIDKKAYKQGDLYIPSLKKEVDEYTDKVMRKSGQDRDGVGAKSANNNSTLHNTTLHNNTIHIMQLFQKTVNPTINYGHKTNRQAIKDLLDLYDMDKVEKLTQYAISVQGKKYAPTITTPYQLKEKLGSLKIYHDREKGSERKIVW